MEMATAKARVCNRCGISELDTPFSKWQATCKACLAAYAKRWSITHRAKINATFQKWEEKNRERRRETHKKTYDKHGAQYKLYKKERYKKDPEKFRDSHRRWYEKSRNQYNLKRRTMYQANPEERKKAAAKWRNENPILLKLTQAKYYQSNRLKFYDANHKRKARMRGLGHIPYKFEDIIERDNHICHICGLKVAKKDESRDHLIPLSRGGSDEPKNVALAHLKCNFKRGADRIPAQLRLLN